MWRVTGFHSRPGVVFTPFSPGKTELSEGSLTEWANRLAIRYAVEGDIRFISHHDSLRLFERALARARIPVRYSSGFNPRPRMTIVMPRPVAVASMDEMLLLELTDDQDPAELVTQLSGQMPEGITLRSAERVPAGERRLPCEVRYSLPIAASLQAEVARRASEVLAEGRIEVTRRTPESTLSKRLDVRPFILSIEVVDERVTWTQLVTPDGTVRVGEMLEALGLMTGDHLHQVCRESLVCRG